jgi:hypothetical protein
MPRSWIRIIGIAALVIFFDYCGAYIFLALELKPRLIKQLEDSTHRKVTVGDFAFTPPFNIEIKNLNIEGLAKIDTIIIAPSLPAAAVGVVAFNSVKVIKPEITIVKNLPKQEPAGAAASASGENTAGKKKNPLRFVLKRFKVKDGRVNFIDHTAGNGGIKITLRDLQLNISNLYFFPRSAIAYFDLKAKIPWQAGAAEGKLDLDGWINLFKKDMQASLKIEDIDGVYLYPYYSAWVDLEKARIEKARLNFLSNIQGLNNNVTAQCHLELADIVRRPLAEDEAQAKAAKIADAVLDIFKALNEGKIVLDFNISTKMDRPEFNFADIKSAFESKISAGRRAGSSKVHEVLVLPATMVESTVKGATGVTNAVIEGVASIARHIKKAVTGELTREKKREENKTKKKK